MTSLAVMQPYLFPYIGYWQLMRAADRFVIFDDVSYINRGWINRNRVLLQGAPALFTLPLLQASQNRKICDIEIAPADQWRKKMLRTFETAYRKAPYFSTVFPVIEQILDADKRMLADLLACQLQMLAALMHIEVEIIASSRVYGNADLVAQDRILDICRREQASVYINAQGGRDLYDAGVFNQAGIDLRFIAMQPRPYPQRTSGFEPYLSIIDALMELGPEQIGPYLDAYELS